MEHVGRMVKAFSQSVSCTDISDMEWLPHHYMSA